MISTASEAPTEYAPSMSLRDEIWGEGWTVDPSARVQAVIRFESLLAAPGGSRRAVVEWSDGSLSEGLRWYEDEILVGEGDLVGKTASELRALKFSRDRDWLQS